MNAFKPMLSLYAAQAREFLRDRTTVLFVLLLPVMFGVFFGLVFAGGGGFTLLLGVANEDAGPAGARLVEQLQSAAGSGMDVRAGARADLLRALDRAEVHVVLVLPAGLSQALAAGQPVDVGVYYDPARPASAGLGLGTVRTLLGEANLALSGAPRALTVQAQAVQAHPLRAIDFYLPGMLGVALLWLGVFGTAQPVVAQRQAQVYRRFGLTPVTRTTMLAAEAGWRMSIGLIQAGIFLAVGYFGFGVGVRDWPLFVGTVLLGTAVFVCLGYTLAGLARSAEAAMSLGQVLNFPMMMLSGSIFSTDVLPAFFRPVVAAMPLTYLSDLLRYAMVGATPTYAPGLSLAVLAGWLALLAVAAVRLWRWE